MERKIPVVAVVGPTASGKSGLAVEIALRKDGEVISADSMQIYRGMQIGTAKPTKEEMRGVPHHLIDFAELTRPFSVADYVELASGVIREVGARGETSCSGGGGLAFMSVPCCTMCSLHSRRKTLICAGSSRRRRGNRGRKR